MKDKTLKYTSTILLLLIMTTTLLAQSETAAKVYQPGVGEWVLNNLIVLIGGAAIFGAIWAIVYLNNTVIEVQKIKLLKEHGIEVMKEVKLIEQDPWWKRMYDKSWSLVPVEKEKDILLNHDYDGIKELDNVLPPWWVAMFWGCVVIGFAYLGYYHVWDYGMTQTEEYVAEMEYAQKQVDAFLARQADNVDENNVAIITDENKLALGEATFLANCAACHGQKGEGGIGPNMTDNYWIHGGHVNDIFKTIKYGVPAKGMIAWKSQLRPSDIQNLSSYILTLKGTNPPNSKEPQGELYQDEPTEAITSDGD